jgi:hypothetical protein
MIALHDLRMPLTVSHRIFEHENLVADCASCGALAIGLAVDGSAARPQCAMCHLGCGDDNWLSFPLNVDAYRLLPGVHERLPVKASDD